MGREIKRVSKDFDWPLNIVWKGYLNPYSSTECKVCGGSGLNEKTKQLRDEWYNLGKSEEGWMYHLEQEDVQALLDEGRLMDFTRVPLNEEHKKIIEEKMKNGGNSWLPFDNGYVPTAEEVNAWARKGFGHDCINQWICVEARAKRLGFYGKCPLCEGKGEYWCEDKYEKLCEDWESIEPPSGKYYQLWETTSEGSPISPPMKTPGELADWLVRNNASSFGSNTEDYETWLKFIKDDGWAMSMIVKNGDIMSGVKGLSGGE